MRNEESLSVKFLNEILAERGVRLRVKAIPIGPVLLVEDDENDALMVRRLFESIDVPIEHVISGKIAIQVINSRRYSLVLLDLRLPDMNGLEVLKAARATFPELHVVILAGELGPSITDQVRGVGYFGVCIKPLRRSDVLDILLQSRLIEIGP